MSDPSMVYLVWQGAYSDASVIAAFTDETAANAYAALTASKSDWGDPHVEAMAIDDPEHVEAVRGLKPRWKYSTWYWHKPMTYSAVYPTLEPEQPPTAKTADRASHGPDVEIHYWEGVVTADTEEQARKIATDIYAQKMAERVEIV
jgi:hypothetical protein